MEERGFWKVFQRRAALGQDVDMSLFDARDQEFNVSGWEAVEIALASGKRFRLGTDEPRRLMQALLAAIPGR